MIQIKPQIDESKIQDDFLSWFDSDPKRAEVWLKDLHPRLVYWFGRKGCKTLEDREDNTSNTILRIMEIFKDEERKAKIPSDVTPMQYIYGVAEKILLEYWKKVGRESKHFQYVADADLSMKSDSQQTEEAFLEGANMEDLLRCVKKCMNELELKDRKIITRIFEKQKGFTKKLAKLLGDTENAVRIRSHRIRRERLAPCVKNCLGDLKNH